MKTFPLKAVSILIIAISMLSCSNDNSPSVENSLDKYLMETGFNEVTHEVVNNVYFESGLRFIPKVDGKLKTITVKFPDNQTNLRITIWDVQSQTVYRTEMLPQVSANVKLKKNINPLALTKDKEYLISYCANDWFVHRRTDNTDITYPITCGDIMITGQNFLNVIPQNQIYPWDTSVNLYAGDLDFGFQPNSN